METLGLLVIQVAEMTEKPTVAVRARNKGGLWAARGGVTTGALATFTCMDFSSVVALVAFVTPIAQTDVARDPVDHVKVALEQQ